MKKNMINYIVIVELNNEEFNEKFLKYFEDVWYKKRFHKFYRGFRAGDTIYIRENIKIGKLKLIAHEVGHIYDKKHTKLPTTMNPYWIFRWF